MQKLLTILLVLLSISAMPAQALRCNGKLISTGDEKQKVQDLCGDPVDISYYDTYPEQPVYNYSDDGHDTHANENLLPVTIEVWIYNFGPGQFIRELHFRDNRIISIARTRYGNY